MDVDISGGTLSLQFAMGDNYYLQLNLSLLLGQMHFTGKDLMINTKILKSLNSVKILFLKKHYKLIYRVVLRFVIKQIYIC